MELEAQSMARQTTGPSDSHRDLHRHAAYLARADSACRTRRRRPAPRRGQMLVAMLVLNLKVMNY